MGSFLEISSLKKTDSLCHQLSLANSSLSKGQEFMSSTPHPQWALVWILCIQSQSLWIYACKSTGISYRYCLAMEVCPLCFLQSMTSPGWSLRLTDWVESASMRESNYLDAVPDPNSNFMQTYIHRHSQSNTWSSVCVLVGTIQMTSN